MALQGDGKIRGMTVPVPDLVPFPVARWLGDTGRMAANGVPEYLQEKNPAFRHHRQRLAFFPFVQHPWEHGVTGISVDRRKSDQFFPFFFFIS